MTGSGNNPGDRRMRLLILATTVPAEPGDGTPSFVLDLASALTDQMDVTILAPRVPNADFRSEFDGVIVVRFPFFPRRWEGLANDAIMPTLRADPWRWIEVPALFGSMAWHTWRLTNDGSFSIVNAHWIIPAGIIAWFVRKLRGVPYIVTVHGADAYTLNSRTVRWVKGFVLRGAEAVLPVSGDIARVVGTILGGDSHVSPAVPMGVARPSMADVRRMSDTFLIVGRLAEKKGISVAIRALRDVPEIRLRIIGDGPERDALSTMAADLGVGERVEFLGKRPRADVLAEMAICTGLLIPSVVASDGDTEGTPVVLAEAMSIGTPVIASRLAGLGEFVVDGETGLLVEPGDSTDLSRALSDACSDPDSFSALGQQAAASFGGGPLDVRSTAVAYSRALAGVSR